MGRIVPPPTVSRAAGTALPSFSQSFGGTLRLRRGIVRDRGARLLKARPMAAPLSAVLLIGTAFSAALLTAGTARAQMAAPGCEETAEVAVLPAPLAPWKGAPLRVLVAAEKPFDGELSLIAP